MTTETWVALIHIARNGDERIRRMTLRLIEALWAREHPCKPVGWISVCVRNRNLSDAEVFENAQRRCAQYRSAWFGRRDAA